MGYHNWLIFIFQWIGFVGKILTGNPWVFTMKYSRLALLTVIPCNVRPPFDSVQLVNITPITMVYGTQITIVTNIAMENPNHKWRFLAGKIIYKWSIFHGYVK